MRLWHARRRTLVLLGLSLVVSLALFAVGTRLLFRLFRTPSYRLHMLTDPVPNRQILGRRLAAEATKHRMVIDLSSRTLASLEALHAINERNPIDFGLVPGGVGGPARFPNVRQVAALGTDPLHVMVRPELLAAAAQSLSALRGKRVNCGPKVSGLRVLVHDVLRFAGLEPPTESAAGDYVDLSVSSQDLLAQLERISSLSPAERAETIAKLPDAVIFLSPLPSLLARRLVSTAGYRLVPLPFTEAYALDRLNLQNAQGTSDAEAIDRASIVVSKIPQDLYGTDPAVPPEACETLGTRLLLVAHVTTDTEAIARLLEVVYESPFTGLIQAQPLREQVPPFELHAGTELFLRRRQPFLTPELMSQLGRLLGGIGAFASGLVGLYGFLRILQLRRFEAYYHEIRRIVLVSRGQATDPSAPADPAARRAHLLDRLDDLKSEAVRDFAEGGLRGEGLLAGVVALINDTRNSLHADDRPRPRGQAASAGGLADDDASSSPG
jgi:TRAP-type uncharacterized transport system substrate-binding protein